MNCKSVKLDTRSNKNSSIPSLLALAELLHISGINKLTVALHLSCQGTQNHNEFCVLQVKIFER